MAVLSCSVGSMASPPLPAKRPRRSIPPSQFGSLLQSCIDARSLEQGIQLHGRIRDAGLGRNRDLLPKLVKMYSACGRADLARDVLDEMPKRSLDVPAWTSMMSGYVANGEPSECVGLFVEMLRAGTLPDAHVFSVLLKASGGMGDVRLVGQLHAMAVKCVCHLCLSAANALVHAYGLFGDVGMAWDVFDRTVHRDVVSWSAMIQACCYVENHAEGLLLLSRMQFEEHLKPNERTLVLALPACGFFSSLRRGQAIHAFAIRNGFEENSIVGSALLAMYSQCGEPDFAYRVFCRLHRKNVVVWTSMIEAFAVNGQFDLALHLFRTMQEHGLKPNHVTLVVILSACSHGGLVDEGLAILDTMTHKFGVEPGAEHYACVVDMLGRAGRLDEAERLMQRPTRPTASMLGSLLGACHAHGNVEMGERVAYKLFELEPANPVNYVVLSNIYAGVGRWEDVWWVRRMMSERGLSKEIGCSWIEIDGEIHVFKAHD